MKANILNTAIRWRPRTSSKIRNSRSKNMYLATKQLSNRKLTTKTQWVLAIRPELTCESQHQMAPQLQYMMSEKTRLSRQNQRTMAYTTQNRKSVLQEAGMKSLEQNVLLLLSNEWWWQGPNWLAASLKGLWPRESEIDLQEAGPNVLGNTKGPTTVFAH